MKNLFAIQQRWLQQPFFTYQQNQTYIILCDKENKAAQKTWPDIQADHRTLRLSKKPNSWGFGGAQSSPKEMEVFASSTVRAPWSQCWIWKHRRMTETDLLHLNFPHLWFGTGKLPYPLHHAGMQYMFITIDQSMPAWGCWKILMPPRF